MPVSTCILGTESESTPVECPPVASRRAFSFTRRKQILIGTQEATSPTEAMAARASLICPTVGMAAGYYFWLVARINKDGTTRFKIPEAAEALGVNRRSIERWNDQLVELGVLRIQNRFYKRQLTYSEYTLLPINGIIKGTDTTTKVSQCHYDKSVVTKRAIKKPTTRQVSSSLSCSSSVEDEIAEAGRSASASPTCKGAHTLKQDEHGFDSVEQLDTTPLPAKPNLKDEITSWVKANYEFISEGFAVRTYQSIAQDILKYTLTGGMHDREKWDDFLEDIWPRLQITLPNTVPLPKCGVGWLFMNDKKFGQPNFMNIIASSKYRDDNFTLPDRIRDIGSTCFDPRKGQVVVITGFADRSYTVCVPDKPDEPYRLGVWKAEDVPASPLAVPLATVPPAESVVLASLATPEPQEQAKAVFRRLLRKTK